MTARIVLYACCGTKLWVCQNDEQNIPCSNVNVLCTAHRQDDTKISLSSFKVPGNTTKNLLGKKKIFSSFSVRAIITLHISEYHRISTARKEMAGADSSSA